MSKPSTTNGAINIPTRYALVKRAKKLLKEVDDYFEDACGDYGLSMEEADPGGQMRKIRQGLIKMLEREKQLGIVRIEQ